MCWMTIRNDADAVEKAVASVRKHETKNGHAWGLAAAIDGSIRIYKGVGEVPDGALDHDMLDGEADAALAHTRYATRGTHSPKNAHPFPVYNEDDEIVAALAHNGTWHEAPDTTRADSYYIAKELEKRYQACADPDERFEKLLQMTGDYVGETVVVLHRDGRAFAYSGRFDITQGDVDRRATRRSRYTGSSARVWRGGDTDRRDWWNSYQTDEDDEDDEDDDGLETAGHVAGRDYKPDYSRRRTTVRGESATGGEGDEGEAADVETDGGRANDADDADDADPEDAPFIRSSGGKPIPTGEVREL